MNKPISKWTHEPFARFFEEPTRESLRQLLRASGGEDAKFDFKADWPDGPKLAKHILAFANSGGGCLVIGVREEGDELLPDGLANLWDKAKFTNAIKSFFPQRLLEYLNVQDFVYNEAENPKLAVKKFQVAFVDGPAALLPFVSVKDGDGIRENAIYIRRNTESTEANDAELQRIFERKVEATQGSTQARNIKEHLAELKVLYAEIPRKFTYMNYFSRLFDPMAGVSSEPNPAYPKEDFESFVLKLIEEKKALIRRLLEL